ncbi:MAG TPA: tetratricopeptide repeat protein [Thermoanaerobaculia bacterium]|nr:tetratricopeptide repeat protein [Thermoanaerobaculia bacterium]
MFRRALLCLLLTTTPLFAATAPLDTLLRRAGELIAQKELAEAERVARDAVARYPQSREAQSTLAWLTLWNGRYDEARRRFSTILQRSSHDASARLGLAQAEYWSGDLRGARRDFERVLASDPHNAEAQRALSEIRAASAPQFATTLHALDDDQPLRATTASASVYGNNWSVAAATTHFDDPSVNATSIGGGAAFTRGATTLRANASLFRFPDDATLLLPRLELVQNLGTSALSLSADRHELLRSKTALDTHANATSLIARWSRGDRFAVRAESIRYFDDNRGIGADAYFLTPGRYQFGASAAYRDTDQSRFDGIQYDPYYTPQRLVEARLLAATTWRTTHATIGIHLDGGAGHDDISGTFHPWRASLSAAVPLTQTLTLQLRGEHNVTAFYSANEFQASLAGRF